MRQPNAHARCVNLPTIWVRGKYTSGHQPPEELQRFFDEARGTRYYAVLALLFYTGLRRGEVLALRRSDFDLDTLTVTVERAVWEDTTIGTWGIKDKPKRKSSNRTVALPEEARPVLKAHYAAIGEQQLWWA